MPGEASFEQALQALLDGRGLEGTAAGEDPGGLLGPLRVVDAVARTHHVALFGEAAATTAAAAAEGRPARWGHLELGDELGRGASGTVYRAWDTRLAREVALKLLASDEGAGGAGDALTEGRLLARLRHPHIVTVYGADTHDGVAGIWMELVHGDTLDEVLARDGVFGAEEALVVGADLAGALAAVHAAGLLHRDVKARNVIRERGGRVLLMDLGAGRPLDETPAGGDGTGTPLYMAPEVLAGGAATERSDIYSLGVLLHRLLAGSFPLTATGLADLRAAHAGSRRTPLALARPDLTPAVTDLVDRACDPDPDRRFASAADLERALREALAETLASGSPVRGSLARRWSRWRRRVAVAAVALAAMSAGTCAAWDRSPGRAARRAVGLAVGPRSPLYLVAGSAILIVTDGRVALYAGNPAPATALAVSHDLGVLTAAGRPPWTGGASFRLDGTLVGAVRPSTTGLCCLVDGTTDGRFNYGLRQDSTLLEPIGSRRLAPSAIFRFGRDWSDPHPYITLTPGGVYTGVTWAAADDTFWVTRQDTATASIEQWSREGRLLARPVTVPMPALTGLASDPADGTLWAVHFRGGIATTVRLENFDVSGRHLGSYVLPGDTFGPGGAEFVCTPTK
jgi:hypothetical protein